MSTYTYKSLPWVALAAFLVSPLFAADLDASLKAEETKIVGWRRDFHQNPELSNREVRTSGIVATTDEAWLASG